MSVTQFYRETGSATKSAIRHRFGMLEQIGLLRKVGKGPARQHRGPREHVYRAAGPALAEDDTWSGMSDSIRVSDSWRAFTQLSGEVKEAIMAGTLDARPERHLTWSLLSLDRLGWEKSIAAIDERRAFIAEEQDKAKFRLAESGEAPIKMTVAMMAFESPRNSTKAP
jgi:hypothetical protein